MGYVYREQEYNLEVSGVGRYNVVVIKLGSDQCCWNIGFFQFIIFIYFWSKDVDFNWVEYILVIWNIFEVVLVFVWMYYLVVLNGGQQFGWCVSKVIGFVGLWVGDDFFVLWFEELVIVSGEFFIQLCYCLMEINCFVNYFLCQ